MKQLAQNILFVILDGFGYHQPNDYNAISQAHTPHYDQLLNQWPHTWLDASGQSVGLPASQMGNSEVGHLHIGAGRTIYMGLSRINQAIADGSFFDNEALCRATEEPLMRPVHLMGLVSSGGVHSHIDHFKAALQLCKQQGHNTVYIHAFLDGRDTPPKSAQQEIRDLQNFCQELGLGDIVTICGRYYAMDRDQNWERTAAAYNLIVNGVAPYAAATPQEGLQKAYERGETDEFVQPTLIYQSTPVYTCDEASVISINFRADRIRQLIDALLSPDIIAPDNANQDALSPILHITTMTQYSEKHEPQRDPIFDIAFPPLAINDTLGDVLSQNHLKQFRIAETEKYAHVTYFLNGGRESVLQGEKRCLIRSPSVATYDLQPDMAAREITQHLTQALEQQQYGCLIANYANADMVGHTGNFDATVQAIECLDQCLGELIASCQANQYSLILTADHGNAEQMYDPKTNQPHTAHTSNWVPCIYYGLNADVTTQSGSLIDLAPTILQLMGLDIPEAMTGQSLFRIRDNAQ